MTTYQVRRRVVALCAAMGIFMLALVVRLTDVQVVSAGQYETRGEEQRYRTADLPAARGVIYDRNGNELALSADRPTVWANPQLITDPIGTAELLGPMIGIDRITLQDKLTSDGQFVYLARKVDLQVADRVEALGIAGIFVLDEPQRFLPNGAVAAPLIGKTDIDNNGVSGIELMYEETLSGDPGQLTTERDSSGNAIPGGFREEVPAVPGEDLVLTIDRALQFEAERLLIQQVGETTADGGMLLMMDTDTGDLLAIANVVRDAETGEVRPASANLSAINVYEPGSVNKLITVSGALAEGIVSPGEMFQVENQIQVGTHLFTEHEDHPLVTWSVAEIFANSSNIGTIKIAQKLGRNKIDQYLRDFGFGSKTSLNWPNESAGLMLDAEDWVSTTLGSVALGQGIAVTALQMVAAYNTIANDGTYVSPRLVSHSVDGNGDEHEIPGVEPRNVVSPGVAVQVTSMLEKVVTDGTGTRAAIDGYRVAGKTGTARKVAVGGYGYEEGAYVSSFAGFVPADDPQVTIMVVLDEPFPIYGGVVAAPVFKEMANFTMRYLRIPPSPNAPVVAVEETDVTADGDVSGVAEAKARAAQEAKTAQTQGAGSAPP